MNIQTKAKEWYLLLKEDYEKEIISKFALSKPVSVLVMEQLYQSVVKYWTREEWMNTIGFELVSDDGIYSKYQNMNGYKGTFYRMMGKGKIFIYFNRLYVIDKGYIYCRIRDDGDTRTSFEGGISTAQELELILKLIM